MSRVRKPSKNMMFDIVILGGGLVGAVAALKAAQQGFEVAVVESRAFDDATSGSKMNEKDMRTTAVAYGSVQILDNVGVWQDLARHACPIDNIRVFEADSAASLNFLEKDRPHGVGNHPLGYMVENNPLRQALEKALKQQKGVTLFDGKTLQEFKGEALEGKNVRTLELSSGEVIAAPLVIGAEGRHSPSRDRLGIQTHSKPYHQTALVASVAHEKPHHNTAFEVFHPLGPLAFLPFHDMDEGGESSLKHRSAIVWSSTQDLKGRDTDVLARELEEIFPYLGKLSFVNKPAHYPLMKQTVSSYISHRYALVGDAAHVMHPVAGQGVNLGWRDAVILIDLVASHKALGLDIGSLTLLKAYEKARQRDERSMLFVTDRLIWLYAQPNPMLKMLRNAGMDLVDRISPLKKLLMRKAMGM